MRSAPGLAATFERLRGHLRIMRPYAWLWFDAAPATALFLLLDPKPVDPRRFLAFMLSFILADAASTTLNDLCDVHTDRLSSETDRRRRPLVTGAVSPRGALLQTIVLFAASVAIAAAVRPVIGLALAAWVLLGIAYSVPPVRMSSRPWTSQPFWLVFACVYYAAVALLAGQWWTPASVLYALGIVLFMTVGENAAKDIRDWDNDSAANRRTMVVAIGPSRAAGLSLLGCFGGAAAFLALLWSHPTLPAWSRAAGTGLMTYFLARAVAYTSKLRRTFEKPAARALHIGYIRTFLVFNTVIILGLSGNLATSLLLEGRPPALAAHDPARSAGDDHVHGRIGANP